MTERRHDYCYGCRIWYPVRKVWHLWLCKDCVSELRHAVRTDADGEQVREDGK